MKIMIIIYCVVMAAIVLTLLVATLVRVLWLRRCTGRDREFARHYLRIVVEHLIAGGDGDLYFPSLYRPGARLVLAQTLAQLATSTYGFEPSIVRRVVVQNQLESYLLRRARRTRGYRRAWFLALLSRLPVGESTARAVASYGGDPNRGVRFYALMVQLGQDPSIALRLVASHEDQFSSFELAEIVAMLRRGALPVACEPLLTSSERNLRSLGLSIVRQFGIEDAEVHLLRLVAGDDVPELGREALYTLCAMQRPLAHHQVAHRVAGMSPAERKALLRYMALEGYAGGALDGLFSREEGPYFAALLNSYKRTLVWS